MDIEFINGGGTGVPENQKFSLAEGVLLLERQNSELLFAGVGASVTYQLYFDTQEVPAYSAEVELPLSPFDFAGQIEASLSEDGQEVTPEIQVFLTAVYKELKQKQKRKKNPPVKKRTPPASYEADRPPDGNEQQEPEALPVEKKKKKKIPVISVSKKSVWVLVVLFSCLILGVLGVKVVPAIFAEQVPSYETLMQASQYEEAATRYPDKQAAIEQQLYDLAVDTQDSETKEALVQFQQTYPSTFGAFDVAILDHAYDEAVAVYEAHEADFNEEQDRQTLAGYAYLKIDQRKEAERLAEASGSLELEKYIATYDQYQAEIKVLEKQLDTLKEDPLKHRGEIEKTLTALFDTKEKLKNL